jgi:tRNA A-37 threonylcarbamoyl transferase component Bud32
VITNSNNDNQIPDRDQTVRQPSLFEKSDESFVRGSSLSKQIPIVKGVSPSKKETSDSKHIPVSKGLGESKSIPGLKSIAGLKPVTTSKSGEQKSVSALPKAISGENSAVQRNGNPKPGNAHATDGSSPSGESAAVSKGPRIVPGKPSLGDPSGDRSMSREISGMFDAISDSHPQKPEQDAVDLKPVSLDMEPISLDLGVVQLSSNNETTRLLDAMPDSDDDSEVPAPRINVAETSLIVRFGKSEEAELSQNYTVGEQIGRGASGKVYEAWRKRDNKHVVIKVLITENLSDDEESHIAIKRFYREAELISSLHEEHIVECVDYGRYQGKPCMVLEFIDGLSLDQLIIKYGAIPLAYSTGIIEQLLQALVETHSKGIIHRDIKPSNIMVFDTPPPFEIRVLDFGISTVLEGLQSQTLMTQAGNVRGTPSYMAPELFTGETRASVESDLYAVGLCYYECLTGLVAFNDKSFMRVAYKQVNEPLEVPGYIPQGIADIILKLCEKPIRLRYHSAQEVLDDIHANIDKALAEEEACLESWQKNKKTVKRHNTPQDVSGGKIPFKFIILGLVALIAVIIGAIIYINVLLSNNSEEPFLEMNPPAAAAPNDEMPADAPKQGENADEQNNHAVQRAVIETAKIYVTQAFDSANKYADELKKQEDNKEKKKSGSKTKPKTNSKQADNTKLAPGLLRNGH